MIVPFPIAFNIATLACCITYALNHNTFWFRVGFMANCAAVITTVVAVLPGLIDWLSIPASTNAKSTGLKHMAANVLSLGFFTANAAVMYSELNKTQPPATSHIMMTVFGFLIMLYAGEPVQENASEIFTDADGKNNHR